VADSFEALIYIKQKKGSAEACGRVLVALARHHC
jgi:hypothetical protein